MVADLLGVERCSIYLFDKHKDELYCKVITGRLKEPISFSRTRGGFISEAFNSGDPLYVTRVQGDPRGACYNQLD